jgi:hypothetical protein
MICHPPISLVVLRAAMNVAWLRVSASMIARDVMVAPVTASIAPPFDRK